VDDSFIIRRKKRTSLETCELAISHTLPNWTLSSIGKIKTAQFWECVREIGTNLTNSRNPKRSAFDPKWTLSACLTAVHFPGNGTT
jgi:hypothetical protein